MYCYNHAWLIKATFLRLIDHSVIGIQNSETIFLMKFYKIDYTVYVPLLAG